MIQNNNSSMKTSVETFLVEETIDLIHDNDSLQRWNDKVSELQLVGQTEVIKEDKSPIPFLWMNSALVMTFTTLCPTKVDIKKYNRTPIPVELLDMVSLCVKEGYFDHIQVWYNEREKDPAIIGILMNEGHKGDSGWYIDHYSQKYLIGRWADVKASLDTLIERAKKIFFTNETLRLKQEIKDAQRKLEDLETTVNQNFGGAMPETILGF